MARKSRYISKNNELNIALYVRLSDEDRGSKESQSVKTQKQILEDFLVNFETVDNYKFYVDDGYVGGNFDRPAFQTMINDVVEKKINCVIVKDLSRFGRDYKGLSDYLQVLFPTFSVRFISINDRLDTLYNADMLDPLIIGLTGLMNEQYLKDLSIKSKMSYSLRQNKGQFTSPVAPYGYKRKEDDIHKLEIDEEVVDVVKFIYQDFIEKQSFNAVTKDLSCKGIPTPSEHKQSKNPKYYTNRLTNKEHIWSSDSVKTILTSIFYIGHTAQNRRTTVDFKTKKVIKLPKNEWVIVENTHEPIIDIDTFNEVQTIIQQRKMKNFYKSFGKKNNPDNYFSGLLYCGNCGSRMTYLNDKNRKYTLYKCKLRSMSPELCDEGYFKTQDLAKVVLATIKQYAKLACDMEETINQINKYKLANQKVNETYSVNTLSKLTHKYENEIAVLYEQYRAGEIDVTSYKKKKEEVEYNFNLLKNKAKKEIETKAKVVENEFIKTFKKAKGIKQLTPELVKSLISKIIVHSATNLEIHFKFQDEFENAIKYIEENKN